MVKDYLEKIRQEYIEHKVSLEEQISSYENKVKENTKFLQVLEKETNPGYEAFSPREFNSFHKEKMEELRADQKRISNEIMCLRDQMQEYEFRIADITSVIKEETEIERKIHEAADIDSYDTRLALLRSVETERQRIARELHDSTTQNLTAIVHKTELCSKIIESDPVKCKLELFSPLVLPPGTAWRIPAGASRMSDPGLLMTLDLTLRLKEHWIDFRDSIE